MDMTPAAPELLFRALADPTRRSLFERLAQGGEQTVRALTAGSGVTQPAVSRHLAQLKRAGLVHDRRAGRDVHYRADAAALTPLAEWMARYARFWGERFDNLEDLLKRMDQ